MTDDVSKLPAWPEAPFTNTLDSDYELAWSMFYRRNADAYRARMEALVERIKRMHYAWRHDLACARGNYNHTEEEPCTCGFDALLAACEREEGR